MKKKLLVSLVILGLVLTGLIISNHENLVFANNPENIIKDSVVTKSTGEIKYNPPSPKDAPANIRDAVMLGYNIMNNTSKYAGKYVGNKLNCSNCHFNGGITEGGKKGGLSLVGVTTEYPKYRSRAKAVVDMVFRTNSCFVRSMNGKPLPGNSKEMIALITYFQWISKGLPVYQKIPWLGLKHIKNNHKPNFIKGKQIYTVTCAACHGTNGLGTKVAPPLWGKDSFNDGAGMSHLANLAAFAHNNMPYKIANLTENQAIDVAAYVTKQPRPHFSAK